MTHADLVDQAERWLWRQGCGIVLKEFRTLGTLEIPDAIGWRTDASILIECKVSRSDFHADARKPFRADPARGIGDWRFYLTPPGLLAPEDLPDGWGLLEAKGSRVYRVHGGWKGNTEIWRRPNRGNREAEMWLMYSALRRLTLRGHLSEVYTPLESAS